MNWWQKVSSKFDLRNIQRLLPEQGRRGSPPAKWRQEWRDKERFRGQYSFAIPTEEAIKAIKKFVGGQKVVEVGAGLGFWAKLLQDAGVHLTPIDAAPPASGRNEFWEPDQESGDPAVKVRTEPYTKIVEAPAEEYLPKNDASVMLMVWPPLDESMAFNTLKAFRGNKIIHIGESRGGCTGCDKFFDLLYKEWQVVGEVDIPQWSGLHDYITFYTRKN